MDWETEGLGNICLHSVNSYDMCSMLQLTSGISSTANSDLLQSADSPQNVYPLQLMIYRRREYLLKASAHHRSRQPAAQKHTDFCKTRECRLWCTVPLQRHGEGVTFTWASVLPVIWGIQSSDLRDKSELWREWEGKWVAPLLWNLH